MNILAGLTRCSDSTQRVYSLWIARYLGDVDLEHLTEEMVQDSLDPLRFKEWLDDWRETGLARRTLQQAHSSILWMAQEAAANAIIPYERVAAIAAVKTPKGPYSMPAGRWLNKQQTRKLLDQLEKSYAENPALQARNRAMIYLLIFCGLRRHEIVEACWQDFNAEQTYLMVHGKGNKLRQVKLPPRVVEALQTWKGYHPRPLPQWPIFTRFAYSKPSGLAISDGTVCDVVREVAQAAGIPHLSPHDLRRTFARGAYESGASFELIRQILGHSSVQTTERYINPRPEMTNSATDQWSRTVSKEDG